MDTYWLAFAVTCLAQGVFAASIALCWGRAGILTLGPSLYFGLGAYGAALAIQHQAPLLIGACLLCVVVVAAAIAMATTGKPGGVLRYAACTMVLALLAQRLAVRAYDLTGGSNGITVPRLHGNASMILAIASMGGCLLVLLGLVAANGRFRQVLLTLRDNPEGLLRLGYDLTVVRTLVVIITALAATVAGALYAPAAGIVSPELFSVSHSMQCLAWVVIGARRPLAAFVAAIVVQTFELLAGSSFSDWYLLAVAAVLVAACLLQARGRLGLMAVPS